MDYVLRIYMFDWKKEYKELYFPKAEIASVQMPKMNYLMIDGAGNPNDNPQFQVAVEALYSLSYTIRFNIKNAGGPVYSVMPLEGLWWAPDMKVFMDNPSDKSTWLWTLMIAQPDFVTAGKVEECRKAAIIKKGLKELSEVRFEAFDEGSAAQMMYTGPYADEGLDILRIHEYITSIGGDLSGKHHEIYLSDQRKVAPEKLKTVIRQPFSINK
jgi:hypothetical protein